MRKLRSWDWLLGMAMCLCIVLSLLLCSAQTVSAAGSQGMITIELSDSYGDGWSDNAIEIYVDGELFDTATMDDGASATWTTTYDPHSAYEFRWINGIYSQETSFVIYVGTEQKVSASGYDYGGGATILSVAKACSVAKYVNGVCSNCGAACTHSYVGKNGTCADCGRACSGHIWTDGVCSVCSGSCLHEAYSEGKCSVCGKKMLLSIEMEDMYSDGWTDNAINIYADGVLVETVTIDSGFTGFWSTEYNAAATYTFEWVCGAYPEECSFRILLVDKVCYEATTDDCADLAEEVFYTLEPWCDHAAYDDKYCCTSCGKPCPHTGLAPKGTCGVCGFTCGTSASHIWVDDACKVCGLVCAHTSWTNSVCNNCGFACGTEARHNFNANNTCTICGFVCGTSAEHAWDHGICGVCGLTCAHGNWKNFVCGSCGLACGSDAEHSFDAKHTCTVCGFVCGTSADHAWNKGTCEVCGMICDHKTNIDGVCTVCDYWQPAVANGVGENGFALYEIHNVGQLLWFADYVNSHEVLSTITVADTAAGEAFYFEYTTGCVNGKLMADIDMSGMAWTPIGIPYTSLFASRNSYGYAGTFDGNGHTVSGIDCTVVSEDSTVYAGFFGAIGGGTVKNLTVKGNVRGTSNTAPYPAAYVGGIVGYVCEGLDYAGETTDTQQDVYAGIVNCTFIGSVSVDAKDQEYAGGIVGMASATTVKNCFCAAAVSATEVGDHSIGSLCGLAINECTITNCWYDSTVSSLGEVNKEDHDGVTGLSTELLALGSAAHALGFGQTLGVDPYPSYGDDPVYQVTTGCCTYSNTKPSGVTQKSHAGGSCTGKAICADCGVLYGENLGHSYVGGKCTNCDDTKPVSISGTFNDWGHTDMVWTESGYTYSMELPAGTYEFKLVKDGAWLGNNGIIVDTTTTTSAVGWEFVDANNCQLVATGGTYYFTFNFDTSMLVITYNHTHSHTAGKVVAPTCTAAGYTVYTCACGDSYNGDEVAKLGHSYKTVVTKPTCTTAGKSTHTCSTCNDSYVTDVVAALGHTWLNANCTTPKTCSVCGATEGKALGHSYHAEVTEPTCTAGGFTTYHCSACGNSYVTDQVAALGHTWVAATCTTVKTCSVCGATEGGTLEHRYNVVVTAPTCTAAGYSTYTCAACGDSYIGNTVAATGHSYVGGKCTNCDDTKSVSISGTFNDWGHTNMIWTESGYTYYIALSAGTYQFKLVKDGIWLGNNGTIFDTTTGTSANGWEFTEADNCTLIATGGTYYFTFNFDTNMLVITQDHTHSYAAGKVVAPTCDAAGYTVYTCACGDSYNSDQVAALGHDYQAVITLPTCTLAGHTTHTCSRCNDSYITDEAAALGHTWVNADCTTPKTCSVCGATEGKALGHSYQADVTAPTCTTTGYTTYTCSVCGASHIANEVAALGHHYNAVVTDPTCTQAGHTTYTCSACGHSYTDNTVAATGHSYVGGKCTSCGDAKIVSVNGTFNNWGVADMTWTEDGYTCSIVLSAGTYEFKLVKDGIWLGNEGVIVDTTTTTSAVGWEFVDANNCQLVATGGTYHFTFSFDTNMLVITYDHTHSHTAGKVVAPTCTAAGYTVYTCACGDSYNGDEVAKLGHSYKTVVTKPTCTTAGKSTHTCSTCNDSYVTDEVAALGHTWLNANCTTPKTCSVCGATEGKALGHTWVAATCTTVKTCSVCGATEGGTLDHRYNVVVTAPTCTAAGYSTYTCSCCGDSYHGDEVAALGHSYENGTCIRCGAVDLDYVQRPILTLQYPTLTFEDVITMNVFFQASNLEDVVEMGLITYKSQVTDYGVDTAETVIPGYHEASGLYFASTAGIPAKEMGDTYWFAVYAKLSDGSYVYTRLVSYSPTQYAYGQLSDPEMSKLVVAMLNYGAAAQTYFNYRTDDLMNKNLTAAQQASIETYRADMMDPVVNVDSSKVSIFTNNGGFSRRYPTITFEGAFCIDYYFTPAHTPSGNVSMYYWTQDAYEAADILSPFNASGCLIMVPDGTGAYKATIEGIAAKDLDKTIYVASGYNSGRSVYCSGVLAYSIGAYCVSQAATTDAMAPFAQATAVYGYYAKELFY